MAIVTSKKRLLPIKGFKAIKNSAMTDELSNIFKNDFMGQATLMVRLRKAICIKKIKSMEVPYAQAAPVMPKYFIKNKEAQILQIITILLYKANSFFSKTSKIFLIGIVNAIIITDIIRIFKAGTAGPNLLSQTTITSLSTNDHDPSITGNAKNAFNLL